MKISLAVAELKYPRAFDSIQQQIRGYRDRTDADLVQFAAVVALDSEIEMLRIVCIVDMVPVGSKDDCGSVVFQAPTSPLPVILPANSRLN